MERYRCKECMRPAPGTYWSGTGSMDATSGLLPQLIAPAIEPRSFSRTRPRTHVVPLRRVHCLCSGLMPYVSILPRVLFNACGMLIGEQTTYCLTSSE